MKPTTLWKIRSTMGWGAVGMSALAAGLAVHRLARALEDGASWLSFIEPVIFLVFAFLIIPTANSFLDRRRSGLP